MTLSFEPRLCQLDSNLGYGVTMPSEPDATRRRRRATRARALTGPSGPPPARFAVSVDIVVLTILGETLHLLLVEQISDPLRGTWALPRRFKGPDETLDETALRALREETGLDPAGQLEQLAAFGDPDRGTDDAVVGIAYRAVVPRVVDLVTRPDTGVAALWPAAAAVDGAVPLAFDHARVIRDTLDRTSVDLATTDLALSFVGSRFTLTELRSVFEAVWGTTLDPANFRRTLLGADEPFVEQTGRRGQSGPGGGRPPELYKAAPTAWRDGGPLRQPRSLAKRRANRRLAAQIRSLRSAGKIKEALDLVPSHWTSERAHLLAALDAQRSTEVTARKDV
jgi:8-oxo-dGTP diphosphatase